MHHDADAPPPLVDDDALLAWLDGRSSHASRARVEALLRDDPASRDLLFALARGPSAAFARAAHAALDVADADPVAPPDYHLTGPYGGVRAAMSAPHEVGDAPPIYAAEGTVDVILRPGAPLSRAPVVHAYRARGDGPLELLDVALAVAPGGAMRLRAPAARVFAAPGRHALCIGIGADPPAAYVGRSLVEARALDPDVRWLAVDVFFDPTARGG